MRIVVTRIVRLPVRPVSIVGAITIADTSEIDVARRRVPSRTHANGPNIPAEVARGFHETAFLADPAPMAARFPCGSGSRADARASARSAHGGLPIPGHSRARGRNRAAVMPAHERSYR